MGSAKIGHGYKGQATRLHSLLVIEMRRECEHCGKTAPENECGHLIVRKKCKCCMARRKRNTFQCAHIVTRSRSKTRTREDNAYCLCGGCHIYFGKWPVEFAKFIYKQSGKAKYEELKQAADATAKLDWKQEFERLDVVAKAHGIKHEYGFQSSKKKVKKKKVIKGRRKKTKRKKKGERR